MSKRALITRFFEQATDFAVVLVDLNGRVIDWFPGAASTFGYDAAEMLGRTTDPLFTPEDVARGTPRAELETAARHGRAEDDRWMMRSNGARFWANGFVSAVRDERGEIVAFAKLLRDRTDQRAQVELLRNRAAALEAENDALALTLGKVGHELRNPLGVLANAAQLIERGAGDEQRREYAAQLITRQTGYASRLIEDLLELARSRGGNAALRVAAVSLGPLLDEARETLEPRLRAKRVRVDILLAEGPIVVRGDAARLQQVFVNLLDNAVKFSRPGGTVWVSAMTADGEAVVHVRDEGEGMPADLLPKVFELFTQPRRVAPTRSGGLGLGLAIVRENVELHGGTVQVRSEGVGHGAEFRVRLPLGSK